MSTLSATKSKSEAENEVMALGLESLERQREEAPTEEERPPYTKSEELANVASHGLGVAVSLAALVVMVTTSVLAADPWKVVSSAVFGAALILLYSASTLYHAFKEPRVKKALRVLDHSAIYILIAGTYTPYSLVTLRGAWGWTLFGLVWGFAVVGLTFKLLFFGKWEKLAVACYVAMGWTALIAMKPLVEALPFWGLFWLFAGGIFYTGGVVFYVWKRLPYNHAIWHLFVLAGSVSHFIGILLYVL